MPRKTKEETIIENLPVKNTKKVTKKTASKSKASGTTNKKATGKVALSKSTKKSSTDSKAAKKVAAKTTSEKSKSKKDTNLKTTSKKSTTKTNAKKTTKTTSKVAMKSINTKTKPVSIIEYYDLPTRYNQTIVKILAQTPRMLFVYWDISDVDRKVYEKNYGSDFFSKTKPVLIVHNKTMNYSFEIEINDFANSWYLHVNDANCKYEIELGRRPYTHISTIKENYIFVTSSNVMDSPNNHILFEKFNPIVTYKNVKTCTNSNKNFGKLSNYKNMQEIYSIYDLYKEIYKDELFSELSNPSSMSSSFMESSRS